MNAPGRVGRKTPKTSPKVLSFAREAGGAAAIGPVCERMVDEGWSVLLLAKDHACRVFRSRGIPFLDFPSFDPAVLDRLVSDAFSSPPDFLFTSAASLPKLDMTEKYLWKWGMARGIATAGLLDQWQNYAIRFSGPSDYERLHYLPDHIFVMDRLAEMEMMSDGIPREKIIITGQPAFEKLTEERDRISQSAPDLMARLNLSGREVVITFAAEALKRDFHDSLGYDEQTTLAFLGDSLEEVCLKNPGLGVLLMIKLHPENSCDDFRWVRERWSCFPKRIVSGELTAEETLAISDVVVGMTSVMLLNAILFEIPVLSLQLNSKMDSQLAATRSGAIPFVRTKTLGRRILNRLLTDEKYMRRYVARQNKWKVDKDGTENCLRAIEHLVEARRG